MTLLEIVPIVILGVSCLVALVLGVRHARALRRSVDAVSSVESDAAGAEDPSVAHALSDDRDEKRARTLTVNLARELPLKVLLADDTAVNQMLIQRIFAKMGYEIEVVDNGRAAVESASEHDYDLILMDIQMPEMDGIEAGARILENARTRGAHTPTIIAVTANASEENRRLCMDVGMVNFIPKPFTLERLEQVVARFADASV